jgi:hypothetical protein
VTEATLIEILSHHLPEKAIGYCYSLWQRQPFTLRLANARHSKAGDFSVRQKKYVISVNHDLNPYQFLITYIHEAAHLYVHRQFGRNVNPHGRIWKNEFKKLLQPLLTPEIFPPRLLQCLVAHMQKPRASTFADAWLTSELRQYDPPSKKGTALDTLDEGSLFKLRGRCFKKGTLRKTRFLCVELSTNRNYLVPRLALVEQIEPAMI